MELIKQYQLANNLVADGILGRKTLQHLQNKLSIPTQEALAHFIGQVAHETGNFSQHTENLNYSAAGLLSTFNKYFESLEDAKLYAHQPIKIANRVYANRMGNGDEASGDGFKFRGRGALQLTGQNNYQKFSDFVGDDCVKNPDLVATKYFFESAKFFFDNNKLWKLTTGIDDKTITSVTKKVNGGTNGLKDRISKTKHFYQLLQ